MNQSLLNLEVINLKKSQHDLNILISNLAVFCLTLSEMINDFLHRSGNRYIF